MHKIRDIILCHKELFSLRYHVLGWAFFIAYEISLFAAIRGKISHPVDYLLHYSLYICFFYINTFVWLALMPITGWAKSAKLAACLLAEAVLFYLLNMAINFCLIASRIDAIVSDPWSKLFTLATLYRFVYVGGLSTAFTLAVNLSRKQKNLSDLTTRTLMNERQQETLRAELAGAELSFLRAQINPHLIFNTLNKVYNTVRKRDMHCGDQILALAELMQYSLKTKGPTDLAVISHELDHLQNYVRLQCMSQSAIVALNIDDDGSISHIIPLILYTVAENVFQHGDLKSTASIKLMIQKGKLAMVTKNAIRPDRQAGHGVGLANIQKRLAYHYPDRFSLTYGPDGNFYMLELRLYL